MKPKTPSSSSNSVAPAYLLMAGILAFGLGSAYMVLRPEPANAPEPARLAQRTEPTQALTEQPSASTAAPSAAASGTEGAASGLVQAPSQPAQAPAPAPAPAPAAPRSEEPAPKTAKPVVRAPARKAAPAPAAHDEAAAEPQKVSRPKAPAGDNVPLAGEQAVPKAEVPAAERADKQDKPPKAEAADKAPRAPKVDETEPKPAVKPLTAPALVPIPAEPKVVAATDERAYVRLDDKRTVIVKKGETVQGLGAYLGLDGTKAKFESGTLPITTN